MTCWLRHKWSKWTEPEGVTVNSRPTMGGVPVGEWRERYLLRQQRACERCGLYQRRLVDVDGTEVVSV